MPTVTEHKPVNRLQTPLAPSVEGRELVMPRRVRRVPTLKLHLEAFVVGTLTMIAVWAMLELESVGGWPNRMNEHSRFGSWDSWGLWTLLTWGSIVAVHAVVTSVLPASTSDERRRSDHSRP